MPELIEMEVSFDELFNAISIMEDCEFIVDEEYYQQENIQILNEESEWCDVPALIKKRDEIVEHHWSDGTITETARHHKLRVSDTECKKANHFKVGDTIEKSDSSIISLIESKEKSEDFVYDLQINSENHLYQTANGVVHHNTLLAQTIARMLDVPFAMADATSLTEAGYVGDDVENIIVKLLQSADGDIEKTQRGIIYIDEIDKLSRRGDSASITRDVGGEGVQQAILKVIEGSVCRVPPEGGRKHPNQDMVEIDTTNILFILGGAFVGLDKIIENRSDDGASIGFGANVKGKADEHSDLSHLLEDVQPKDLHFFGMIPEFVGRVPVRAALRELTEPQLKLVLTEPKNAITRQFIKMFGLEKVELEFNDDALSVIAKMCIKDRTGARGLRSIFEKHLLQIQFDLPELAQKGLTKMVVTAEFINGDTDAPIMVYENTDQEQPAN